MRRGGTSADLQGEADFCRSTRAFFTSCSSILMPTSPWRSSPCCRRPIVDKSSPRAAFEVRHGPVHRFSPQCAACLACSTPARVSRASHAPLHTTRTATLHPHCLTHPPRPPFCPCAVAAAAVHKARPSPPHRSTPLWPQMVILDFLDTYSSISRRWLRHFLVCEPFLRSGFQRAVCIVIGM